MECGVGHVVAQPVAAFGDEVVEVEVPEDDGAIGAGAGVCDRMMY